MESTTYSSTQIILYFFVQITMDQFTQTIKQQSGYCGTLVGKGGKARKHATAQNLS